MKQLIITENEEGLLQMNAISTSFSDLELIGIAELLKRAAMDTFRTKEKEPPLEKEVD